LILHYSRFARGELLFSGEQKRVTRKELARLFPSFDFKIVLTAPVLTEHPCSEAHLRLTSCQALLKQTLNKREYNGDIAACIVQ
jgi:hypothetical protein